MKHPLRAALLFPALLLSGCGMLGTQDGAPAFNIDVSTIPDAVPRPEPRSRYGNPEFYDVAGKRYFVLKSSKGYHEQGLASWYGTKFHGRKTSSGEIYDMLAMTAAHKRLPLPTYLEVTNLENGKKAVVKVNDRGPFRKGRILDLSYAAAAKLGMLKKGTARVSIRAIEPQLPADRPQVLTLNTQPAVDTTFQPLPGTPTPVASAAPGRQDSTTGSALFLQVGAFRERLNAERLRDRLLEELAPAGIHISTTLRADRPIYRVSIGPLPTSQDAVAVAEKLASLGLGATRVVSD